MRDRIVLLKATKFDVVILKLQGFPGLNGMEGPPGPPGIKVCCLLVERNDR